MAIMPVKRGTCVVEKPKSLFIDSESKAEKIACCVIPAI